MDAGLDNFMKEKVRLREYGDSLEKLAADCEAEYLRAGNAQARAQAFHTSSQAAAKALTDVAYRVNLLAQTLANVLESQGESVKRLDAAIGQLDAQADSRLETAAKQRLFALTAKKPTTADQPKVDGPKYVRRTKVEMKKFPPLNYDSLDRLGHGLILTPSTSVGRLSGVIDMDKFRAKQAEEMNLLPDANDEDAKTDEAVEGMYSKLRKGRSPSKGDDENVYERVDDAVGSTFGARTLERIAVPPSPGRSPSPKAKYKTLPPPGSGGRNSPRLSLNRSSSNVNRPKHAPPPPPTKLPPRSNGTSLSTPSTNRNHSLVPPPQISVNPPTKAPPSSTNGTAPPTSTTNQNPSPVPPPQISANPPTKAPLSSTNSTAPSTSTANRNPSPLPPPIVSTNQSDGNVPPSPDDDTSGGTGSLLAAIKAAKLKSRKETNGDDGTTKKQGVRISVNDCAPPPPPP